MLEVIQTSQQSGEIVLSLYRKSSISLVDFKSDD